MNQTDFIPKVEFEPASLDREADLLLDFSDSENSFSGMVAEAFPDLKEAVTGAKNEAEALHNCRKIAEGVLQKEGEAISQAKAAFENDWNQVSDEYLRVLSDHLETPWPEDKPVIKGYISILPVCPRFLDEYSFTLYYRKSVPEARVTVAHEILHFLWFKKWKEVFPEIAEEEYETPHLAWRLSEIMDPVILHCHPKLEKMIDPKDWGYPSFVSLKIGEKAVPEHFAGIYRDCLDKQMPFDQIMKIVWEEAQKHRDVLEKF